MAKINPKDFLLNTDYRMDQIILFKSGEYIGNLDISHSLGFTPLIFGVWSVDENFNSANSLGIVYSSPEITYTPPLGVSSRAFKDKIVLKTQGENKDTTKIYYRLYAFQPIGGGANIAPTSNHAKKFILNTDYNYRKIKATGEFTQPNQSYSHGLGYLPQTMAWVMYKNMPDIPDYSTGIEPLMTSSLDNEYYLKVTKDAIKIENFPFDLIDKIIWRVYYDEI